MICVMYMMCVFGMDLDEVMIVICEVWLCV